MECRNAGDGFGSLWGALWSWVDCIREVISHRDSACGQGRDGQFWLSGKLASATVTPRQTEVSGLTPSTSHKYKVSTFWCLEYFWVVESVKEVLPLWEDTLWDVPHDRRRLGRARVMGDNFEKTALFGGKVMIARLCRQILHFLKTDLTNRWKERLRIKEMLEFVVHSSYFGGKSFALFATKDLVSWPGGRSLTVN